jgi:hypothetical protein
MSESGLPGFEALAGVWQPFLDDPDGARVERCFADGDARVRAMGDAKEHR